MSFLLSICEKYILNSTINMSKLLVVLGATGQQGGSIISYILNNPLLLKEYNIRGISRDTSQPSAQALKQRGVEMVEADINRPDSLKNAFKDANTVFGQTNTIYENNSKEKELKQGKAIIDAAVAAGVQYFIWSTSTNVSKITGGKLKQVVHFDVKAEIEEYIRDLPIKSAFYAPGSFMQNLHSVMAPHPVGDGTYAISSIYKPESEIPWIDIANDTGKFIASILIDPTKYEGKVLSAAVKLYSLEEIARALSNATGKVVTYRQVSEEFLRPLLPPLFANELIEMLLYIRDYGYYGALTKEEVEWSSRQAQGKLTTIEEYIAINPLALN